MLRKVLNNASRVGHRRRHQAGSHFKHAVRPSAPLSVPASRAYTDRTQIAGGAGCMHGGACSHCDICLLI